MVRERNGGERRRAARTTNNAEEEATARGLIVEGLRRFWALNDNKCTL